MKNVLEFSKQLLIENLDSNAIVVDATVGNGNDTLFLCKHFKYVYGFDIQKEAVESARHKLDGYSNYELILDSHSNVSKYVTSCNGAIFNLGYLPNSASKLSTQYDTTIKAIENLLDIISNGIIVIVVYVGHDEGVEGSKVETFVSCLPSKYKVLKYCFINKQNAPYILAIEKRRFYE